MGEKRNVFFFFFVVIVLFFLRTSITFSTSKFDPIKRVETSSTHELTQKFFSLETIGNNPDYYQLQLIVIRIITNYNCDCGLSIGFNPD